MELPAVKNNSLAMQAFATTLGSSAVSDRNAAEAIRIFLLSINGVTAPTANAGSSATVPRGRAVPLSGTGSSGGVTYNWQLDSQPATSTAALSSTTLASPTITPDLVGAYGISLIVTSGGVDSAPSRITVTATANAAPSASAGPSQTVTQGTTVTLDGSGSSDPDAGTTLTYHWTPPTGLSSANAQQPTFSPNTPGVFTFSLTVNDEVNTSAPGTVTINVNAAIGVLLPSPSLLTGFSARVGGSVADVKLLTLSNSGSALSSVSLNAFTFTSGYSQDTTHACTPAGACCTASTTLLGAQSCQLWTKFLPSVAGNYSAGNILIGYVASGSSANSTSVTLSGVATQSIVGTTTQGTPPVQTFDSVQNAFSVTKTLTVTNTGNATLNFTSDPKAPARLGGSDRAEYSIVGGSCALAAPLAVTNGSCTLDLRFAPTVANAAMVNPRQATLTLDSDAGNGPLVVTLSGNASALQPPSLSASSLTFSSMAWGDTSASQSVTITNLRSDDIIFALTAPTSTDFLVADDGSASCPGKRISANGGQCSIRLAFRPQSTGAECVGLRCGDLLVTFTPTAGPAMAAAGIHLVGAAMTPLRLSVSELALATMATTSVTGSAIVTNQSAAPVALGSTSFSGATTPFALDGSTTCVANATLAAGAICLLVVRYSPALVGSDEAMLTLPFASGAGALALALHGTGARIPRGRIEIGIVPPLTFADTPPSGSSSQSITVHNAGDAALTFSAFPITGSNAAEFERGGTCDPATPLSVGPSSTPSTNCTIVVTFRPAGLSGRSATLTIRSDGSNDPYPIALGGNGVPVPAPLVSFSRTALDFGTQTVGGLFQPRTVTLTNGGTANLVTSAIGVTGAAFALVNGSACVTTLAPNASCDIVIAFAPTAADTGYAGAMQVTSNAAGSPHSVALTGRGTASAVPTLAFEPVPTQLDFGPTSVGSVSAVQSVTLVNQGPGGVVLTVLNAVGPGAASFSVAPGTCPIGAPLFPGNPCRLDIAFAPGSAGAKSGTLQVASTGSALPGVTLTGTGLAGASPSLDVSATTLTFDTTRIGAQSLPLDVTLSGAGAGVVTVSSLGVSGPYRVRDKSCGNVPFTLPAGASCQVNVIFQPQGEGVSNGVLRVSSDAQAPRDIALSGSGQAAPDVSGGGCSISSGDSATDPTLWLLLALAWLGLAYRRRARLAARLVDRNRPGRADAELT